MPGAALTHFPKSCLLCCLLTHARFVTAGAAVEAVSQHGLTSKTQIDVIARSFNWLVWLLAALNMLQEAEVRTLAGLFLGGAHMYAPEHKLGQNAACARRGFCCGSHHHDPKNRCHYTPLLDVSSLLLLCGTCLQVKMLLLAPESEQAGPDGPHVASAQQLLQAAHVLVKCRDLLVALKAKLASAAPVCFDAGQQVVSTLQASNADLQSQTARL